MKRLALSLILIAGLLSACAVFQKAAQNAINSVTNNGATLSLTNASVAFDPGQSQALQVVVYIGGASVATKDSRCQPEGPGVACFLGDLSKPTTVVFTGTGKLSANASGYRLNTTAPFFLYVRAPGD